MPTEAKGTKSRSSSQAAVPFVTPTMPAQQLLPAPTQPHNHEPIVPFCDDVEQLAFSFGFAASAPVPLQSPSSLQSMPVTKAVAKEPTEPSAPPTKPIPTEARVELPRIDRPQVTVEPDRALSPTRASTRKTIQSTARKRQPRLSDAMLSRQTFVLQTPPPSPPSKPSAALTPSSPSLPSPVQPPTTPEPLGRALGELIVTVIQRIREVKQAADEKRANETPEERQRREEAVARARSRAKRFDEFF